MNKKQIQQYLHIIDQFKSLNIAVIGDFMLDKYVFGDCSRISPEAPVPVVKVKKREYRLGGAGNVVANLAALGCQTDAYGLIGRDNNGKELKKLLKTNQGHSELIHAHDNRITSVKTRIVADRQQVTRIDDEVKTEISKKDADKLIQKLQKKISGYDAVILSDYGKGVLTSYVIQNITAYTKKIILVDPKGSEYSKYHGATIVKPNFKEFKEAVNAPEMALATEKLEHYAEQLRKKIQLDGMVITLGDKGVFIQNPKGDYRIIPTRAKEVFDVSGAGDTFTALFTLAMALQEDWFVAGDIANHGSGIVVGKTGTTPLNREELIEHIKEFKEN